jgi:nucleotide-binding universal stress UspA family protein
MYRTILLHCNDTRRIKTLLAPTLNLAEAFQAHLTALSVVPPIIVTGAPSGPPMVIDVHCELYRADNPTMRAAFEQASRGRTLVAEWRDENAAEVPVLDVVLGYARAADLIVVAQTDREWSGSYHLDVADNLAVEAGRPVLIIPNSPVHDSERVGDRVLVGWNARKEATRAVFDALPLLQKAREVKVVWVNPQSEREVAQDLPAADICAALARHAVKCQAAEEVRPHKNVGETLLACAGEFGADLLVMGCYGHTRWREFIFGGASRHVLEKMTIPVLMSH